MGQEIFPIVINTHYIFSNYATDMSMHVPTITRTCSLAATAFIVAVFCSAPVAQASSLSTNWNMGSVWEGSSGSLAHHAPQQSRANTTTANGRLTVFWSEASNLVAGDTNDVSDLFLFDRTTKVTQRINIGKDGAQGNGHTRSATISADGRYIGFTSSATNTALGPQCISGYGCTFAGVLDRKTGALTLGSVNTAGQLIPLSNDFRPIQQVPPAIISSDGKLLLITAVAADTTTDVYVRNVQTNVTSQANLDSNGQRSRWGVHDSSISGDGRYVTFTTVSPMVPEDTNGVTDVYVRDLQLSRTQLISRAHGTNRAAHGSSDSANISSNGSRVVYRSLSNNIVPGVTDFVSDIFMYNMHTGITKRVTLSRDNNQSNGDSYNPSITADGSHIAFLSEASNISRFDVPGVDIFLYYDVAQITRRIVPPKANDATQSLYPPVISADGKNIVYQLYNRSNTNPAANAYGIYLNYDPVAHIPFYDREDILDLFP